MKFTTIYRRILPLWPEEIRVSDGYEVAQISPASGKKYYFPMLSKAWGEVEEKVDPRTDTWGDMMVWTMFQEFHSTARNLIQSGESSLRPCNVPIAALEERFRKNLNTEGWEPERDAYEGL